LDSFVFASSSITLTKTTFDLRAVLPRLLPRAIAWADHQQREILANGLALSVAGTALARAVGVAHPELVRVQLVERLPLPEDPELRHVAAQTGLLGPDMVGLTLGHGIYLVRGHDDDRVLSHECRHVHQYERAGSIAAFLPVYLEQVAEFGYWDAPFEVEAREWEGP
jgi:hypothetical protein